METEIEDGDWNSPGGSDHEYPKEGKTQTLKTTVSFAHRQMKS